MHLFGHVPYEDRDIETLKENLANISETYLEEDLYDLFELNGHKINIELLNKGTIYIEDASVQVNISNVEGIFISDQVYQNPSDSTGHPYLKMPRINYDNLNYPNFKKEKEYYVFNENIGDLKHHLPQEIFNIPIRMVFTEKIIGDTIEFECKLFGRNLLKPIEFKLEIEII